MRTFLETQIYPKIKINLGSLGFTAEGVPGFGGVTPLYGITPPNPGVHFRDSQRTLI
jgi:hypothetical protein